MIEDEFRSRKQYRKSPTRSRWCYCLLLKLHHCHVWGLIFDWLWKVNICHWYLFIPICLAEAQSKEDGNWLNLLDPVDVWSSHLLPPMEVTGLNPTERNKNLLRVLLGTQYYFTRLCIHWYNKKRKLRFAVMDGFCFPSKWNRMLRLFGGWLWYFWIWVKNFIATKWVN